jgi:hypothetical protein
LAAIIAALILFPSYNDHLVHDIGAFQIGIGVTALLALMRIDASTAFLGGFLLGTSLDAHRHSHQKGYKSPGRTGQLEQTPGVHEVCRP